MWGKLLSETYQKVRTKADEVREQVASAVQAQQATISKAKDVLLSFGGTAAPPNCLSRGGAEAFAEAAASGRFTAEDLQEQLEREAAAIITVEDAKDIFSVWRQMILQSGLHGSPRFRCSRVILQDISQQQKKGVKQQQQQESDNNNNSSSLTSPFSSSASAGERRNSVPTQKKPVDSSTGKGSAGSDAADAAAAESASPFFISSERESLFKGEEVDTTTDLAEPITDARTVMRICAPVIAAPSILLPAPSPPSFAAMLQEEATRGERAYLDDGFSFKEIFLRSTALERTLLALSRSETLRLFFATQTQTLLLHLRSTKHHRSSSGGLLGLQQRQNEQQQRQQQPNEEALLFPASSDRAFFQKKEIEEEGAVVDHHQHHHGKLASTESAVEELKKKTETEPVVGWGGFLDQITGKEETKVPSPTTLSTRASSSSGGRGNNIGGMISSVAEVSECDSGSCPPLSSSSSSRVGNEARSSRWSGSLSPALSEGGGDFTTTITTGQRHHSVGVEGAGGGGGGGVGRLSVNVKTSSLQSSHQQPLEEGDEAEPSSLAASGRRSGGSLVGGRVEEAKEEAEAALSFSSRKTATTEAKEISLTSSVGGGALATPESVVGPCGAKLGAKTEQQLIHQQQSMCPSAAPPFAALLALLSLCTPGTQEQHLLLLHALFSAAAAAAGAQTIALVAAQQQQLEQQTLLLGLRRLSDDGCTSSICADDEKKSSAAAEPIVGFSTTSSSNNASLLRQQPLQEPPLQERQEGEEEGKKDSSVQNLLQRSKATDSTTGITTKTTGTATAVVVGQGLGSASSSGLEKEKMQGAGDSGALRAAAAAAAAAAATLSSSCSTEQAAVRALEDVLKLINLWKRAWNIERREDARRRLEEEARQLAAKIETCDLPVDGAENNVVTTGDPLVSHNIRLLANAQLLHLQQQVLLLRQQLLQDQRSAALRKVAALQALQETCQRQAEEDVNAATAAEKQTADVQCHMAGASEKLVEEAIVVEEQRVSLHEKLKNLRSKKFSLEQQLADCIQLIETAENEQQELRHREEGIHMELLKVQRQYKQQVQQQQKQQQQQQLLQGAVTELSGTVKSLVAFLRCEALRRQAAAAADIQRLQGALQRQVCRHFAFEKTRLQQQVHLLQDHIHQLQQLQQHEQNEQLHLVRKRFVRAAHQLDLMYSEMHAFAEQHRDTLTAALNQQREPQHRQQRQPTTTSMMTTSKKTDQGEDAEGAIMEERRQENRESSSSFLMLCEDVGRRDGRDVVDPMKDITSVYADTKKSIAPFIAQMSTSTPTIAALMRRNQGAVGGSGAAAVAPHDETNSQVTAAASAVGTAAAASVLDKAARAAEIKVEKKTSPLTLQQHQQVLQQHQVLQQQRSRQLSSVASADDCRTLSATESNGLQEWGATPASNTLSHERLQQHLQPQGQQKEKTGAFTSADSSLAQRPMPPQIFELTTPPSSPRKKGGCCAKEVQGNMKNACESPNEQQLLPLGLRNADTHAKRKSSDEAAEQGGNNNTWIL